MDIKMGDRDFHCWQLEVKGVLTSYDTIIENWIQGSPKFITKPPVPVINCPSYFDVVKIIGELKNHFSKRNLQVLFRGQRNSHNYNQSPPFLRYLPKKKFQTGIIEAYRNYVLSLVYYLEQFHKSVFKDLSFDINYLAWESILAHYGIKTRYIDLVDSIPLAIWFSICNLKEQSFKITPEEDKFGYIFVYGIDVTRKRAEGILDGSIQRLVDLRDAFPPFALRPHSQHAYSLCDLRLIEETQTHILKEELRIYMDYNKFLLSVLKYEKECAMKWLFGDNKQRSDHLAFSNLFPSPQDDNIFERLLEDPFHSPLIWVENIEKIPDEWEKKQISDHWNKLGQIEPYNYAYHAKEIIF